MSEPPPQGRLFPDPRFYETLAPLSLLEIAALTGCELGEGAAGARRIRGIDSLAEAGSESLSFCSAAEYGSQLAEARAGACLVPSALAPLAPGHCAVLITPRPQAALALVADRLHRPRLVEGHDGGVHPTARLEPGVILAPGAIVGAEAVIGGHTRIGPGAVIGPGVAIGRGCAIGARVVIGFALIGDNVRIHAGAVIGEPGFGAAPGPSGIIDMPQLGRVILQDGVTVGANSCIDRGAFEDTVVGENTKIDNLVQVAHNVVIGRNCLLAAYTGISGSAVVGDGAIFGGRAGVSDHIVIGRGSRIAAAAGVMKDVPAGESWGGSPARPVKLWLRETALLARLARRRGGSPS